MSAQRYVPDASVVVVCGHYGVGKTNFSLNLVLDARERGVDVTLVDLDVVNPYFRSSDYRGLLEERGISVIAPVMAGTTLDSPSLSGAVGPAVESARKDDGRERLLVIDAGGDDVGATALGRFAGSVAAAPYEMLYVVNRSRNLTQDPAEAVDVLREVEEKCHLRATAIVKQGVPFAQAVAEQAGLPLACTTVPISLADRKTALFGLNDGRQTLYPVQVYVRTPWE